MGDGPAAGTRFLRRPAPKLPGGGDRTAPLDAVLAKVPVFRERYGITRVADTTRLDRIGIPTMSAFVPRSADVLGVYGGKGCSRDEALVSAVMEAVERQVCAAYAPTTASFLPDEIARDFDLRELGYAGSAAGALPCVPAVNLLTGQRVFVPLGFANPFGQTRSFARWTTNGLAAGSSLIEALFHALFEVVERHLWSEVEIHAAGSRIWSPAFGDRREMPQAADVPDDAVAAEVRLPSGDPQIDDLASAIRSAGISLRLFALTGEAWPVAAFARLHEPGAAEPTVHAGMSCSWSPRRAAVAAIVEAVSSRAIAIQGAREDHQRVDGPRAAASRHARQLSRLPVGRWFFDVPAPPVRLDDLPDRASSDLGDDIRRLLDVIRAHGVRCVAMVDLSPPDGSVHVVRVVAPGLERFTVDGSVTERTRRALTMSFGA